MPHLFDRRVLVMLAMIAMASAENAAAQLIYRSVGTDGRVTFSDRAPPAAAGTATTSAARSSATAGNDLPYALRQLQAQFPIVLYTSNDCRPCSSARALLIARGIPFTEHTVQTSADLQALQKLSGQTQLPFASIGQQHLEGFAADEWHQYLNAAGYPETSVLPSNYRQPSPSPLTTPDTAAATAAAAPPRKESRPQQLPSEVSPTNPAGLSF